MLSGRLLLVRSTRSLSEATSHGIILVVVEWKRAMRTGLLSVLVTAAFPVPRTVPGKW